MASWDTLPLELQYVIWEFIIQESTRERQEFKIQLDAKNAPNSLAACAAVSRKWQGFFERATFERLFINGQDVAQFADVVRGEKKERLGYIRHLHFHVWLGAYGRSESRDMEDDATKKRNDSVFRKALLPFLNVLTTWNGDDHASEKQGTMVLELSAASRSDTQHYDHDFRLMEDYPYDTVDDLDSTFRAYKNHVMIDMETSLRGGFQGSQWYPRMPPPLPAKVRLFGSEPLLNTTRFAQRPLPRPRLDIIGGFRIRRRFYRVISADLIVWLMAVRFRNLCQVHIELWSMFDIHQFAVRIDNARQSLPESFCELHVSFHSSYRLEMVEYYRPQTPTRRTSAAAFARASHLLQIVTLSYVVDATDFLAGGTGRQNEKDGKDRTDRNDGNDGNNLSPQARIATCLWPRLTTLALTDRRLLRSVGEGHTVLELAGRMVASDIPKLAIMELWYGDGQDGCLFRFEAPPSSSSSPPRITMNGTWDMRSMWTPGCQQAWTAAAAMFSDRPLQVSYGLLPTNRGHLFDGFCVMLRHLKLRDKIVDPVSRYQMEWELLCREAFAWGYTANSQWSP